MCHSDGDSVLVQCPAQCVCAHVCIHGHGQLVYSGLTTQAQEGCEELSPWLLVGRLTPVVTTSFMPLFEGRLLGMQIDA